MTPARDPVWLSVGLLSAYLVALGTVTTSTLDSPAGPFFATLGTLGLSLYSLHGKR